MPIRTYSATLGIQTIATGDYKRRGFIIYNNSTGNMYVAFDNETGNLLTNKYTLPLPASGIYEIPFNYYDGNVFAKWEFAVGSGHITEW